MSGPPPFPTADETPPSCFGLELLATAVLLLVAEHSLVRPDDLSKVNLAFFTFNGIISLLLGTLGIIDVFV